MSDNNTAKEFLDLWQKQLSAALTDPATINSYSKLMGDFSRFFTNHSESTKADFNENLNQQPSQPAASAHEFINSVIGQLTARIADVERRLASLEQREESSTSAKRGETSGNRKKSSTSGSKQRTDSKI